MVEKKLSGLDKVSKIMIENLNRINEKLDTIIKQNEEILTSQRRLLRGDKSNFFSNLNVPPDALTLLSLPISFRKTIIALYKLGEATAEDIAKETNKTRTVESGHANQLVRLGYVKKRRKGRKVYFYIE